MNGHTGMKIKHFYSKNNRLTATLVTVIEGDSVIKAGLSVAKTSEPIITKNRGTSIAIGRMKDITSVDDIGLINVPNRTVTDFDGSSINLKEAVTSAVSYSLKNSTLLSNKLDKTI